ncbi:hypothetical protein F4806DRAFT_482991 [Annulohypoxylon nitens]|nr:hypothetical protein F4806DRAFT_482991 [Annulohypoxylon nitens]
MSSVLLFVIFRFTSESVLTSTFHFTTEAPPGHTRTYLDVLHTTAQYAQRALPKSQDRANRKQRNIHSARSIV